MPRVLTRAGLALAAAAFAPLAAACRDQGPSAEALARARRCDVDMDRPTITVTPGPQPTISWSPPCRVSDLIVYDPAAPPGEIEFMWFLSDSTCCGGPRAGFPPPVRYGVRAPGTREGFAGARPLEAGVRYPVHLWAWADLNTIPIGFGAIAP